MQATKIWKNDAPERRQILAEIYERLDSVEQKIIELENATASQRTKDEEKQKLAEILKREEYAQPQEQEESVIQNAYRRFIEWLKSVFPKPESARADRNEQFSGTAVFSANSDLRRSYLV